MHADTHTHAAEQPLIITLAHRQHNGAGSRQHIIYSSSTIAVAGAYRKLYGNA